MKKNHAIITSVIAALFAVLVCSTTALAWLVPDTGQTKCYNGTVEIALCPSEGQAFYGQDGSYPINTPSYTKLNASGAALLDSATTWAMVRDNVSGLIWENKTDDDGIHDKDTYYTWQESQDTFIAQLNSSAFGGYTDWRLPTPQELYSITNLGTYNPAINTAYFPYLVATGYWSSTTVAGNIDVAWYVNFNEGDMGSYAKTSSHYVRAVRSGQSGPLGHLVINAAAGTVTDTATGLMWQRATAPGIGSGSNPGQYIWEQALAYCENLSLATYTDWRLPTPKELQSLVDYSISSPGPTIINTTAFPGTQPAGYWSSTTDAGITGYAWTVYFGGGGVGYGDKTTDGGYVRAVRSGQSGSFYTFVISRSGAGTVTSADGYITCGTDCVEQYEPNAEVTLTAAAATGSTFTGWSGGGCTGTGDCVVTMDAAKSITAQFEILATTTTTTTAATTTTSTVPATTTSVIPSTTTSTGPATTTTTVSASPCPATKVLGADNPKLENLRGFRDSKLAQSAVGRRIIRIYYNNADSINAALDRSQALRAFTRRVLEVIAPMVGRKEE